MDIFLVVGAFSITPSVAIITVVVLRCTQKLLRRLGVTDPKDELTSTTALGDWYGNLLFTRPVRILLFISEVSRLPVLLPARDLTTLTSRFPSAVSELLQELGVEPTSIAQEREVMSEVVFGTTRSRSILGSLNDFAYHLKWALATEPQLSLCELALKLSEIPSGPLGYEQPREVACRLLGANETRQRGI